MPSWVRLRGIDAHSVTNPQAPSEGGQEGYLVRTSTWKGPHRGLTMVSKGPHILGFVEFCSGLNVISASCYHNMLNEFFFKISIHHS